MNLISVASWIKQEQEIAIPNIPASTRQKTTTRKGKPSAFAKQEPQGIGMPNTIKMERPSFALSSGPKKRTLTSNTRKSSKSMRKEVESKTPLKSVEHYDSVINKLFAEHTKGMNLKY